MTQFLLKCNESITITHYLSLYDALKCTFVLHTFFMYFVLFSNMFYDVLFKRNACIVYSSNQITIFRSACINGILLYVILM